MAGKIRTTKNRLAEVITKDVMHILHYGEESASVAIDEVSPQEWIAKVYNAEIKGRLDTLYKKPGYDEMDL